MMFRSRRNFFFQIIVTFCLCFSFISQAGPVQTQKAKGNSSKTFKMKRPLLFETGRDQASSLCPTFYQAVLVPDPESTCGRIRTIYVGDTEHSVSKTYECRFDKEAFAAWLDSTTPCPSGSTLSACSDGSYECVSSADHLEGDCAAGYHKSLSWIGTRYPRTSTCRVTFPNTNYATQGFPADHCSGFECQNDLATDGEPRYVCLVPNSVYDSETSYSLIPNTCEAHCCVFLGATIPNSGPPPAGVE